jgi:hypothetical protein
MLDPEIATFGMTVEEPTDDPVDIDGETDPNNPPKLAGPRFKFNFGGANFGAGTQHQGLFEITIEYDETTKMEPRWYDENNQRWSKVGIIDDSVKWDYPEDGYVTFKVSHLTEFAVVANVADSTSGLTGDFDNNGICDLSDIAIYMGWFMKGRINDKTAVKDAAEELYAAGAPINIVNLPSTVDDFSGEGNLDLSDIAMFMSWFMKGRTNDPEAVNDQAAKIYPSVVGTVGTMPGTKVNR